MENQVSIADLYNLIISLQKEIADLKETINNKNIKKVSTRGPKVVTNLLPNTHYMLPFEWALENFEFIEKIVSDASLCDNCDNFDVNANFILTCLNEKMGLPIFHKLNGVACIHRYGKKRFNVLKDLNINEEDIIIIDKNTLKDVEKENKIKYLENKLREERLNNIIWKDEETKNAVLSRKYNEEE